MLALHPLPRGVLPRGGERRRGLVPAMRAPIQARAAGERPVRALDHALVVLAAYLAGLCTAALVRWLRHRSTRHWTCVLLPGHEGPCRPGDDR